MGVGGSVEGSGGTVVGSVVGSVEEGGASVSSREPEHRNYSSSKRPV